MTMNTSKPLAPLTGSMILFIEEVGGERKEIRGQLMRGTRRNHSCASTMRPLEASTLMIDPCCQDNPEYRREPQRLQAPLSQHFWGSVRIQHPAPLSAETTEIMVVSDVRLAGLVRVLMSSARESGIPCEYASGNSLARRMKEVFTFPLDKAPGWLWKPLFDGLMNGGESVDVMVVPPAASSGAQPMPYLGMALSMEKLTKGFFMERWQ